ncbi:MAG: hydrogenase formation protein HypD [Desulfatibacillaceae bacterium]|nr:hydrogenase formation protein HypD [Desulfatibacillaceae bacterium]
MTINLVPYSDAVTAARLAEKIFRAATRPLRLMEVCGTHTTAIFRHGIRSLLPKEIELISGPGCPVCVTSQGDIDAFIALCARPNIISAVFGDMVKVPGSQSSLAAERAKGADIRVVYSPLDAVELAARNPLKDVVFWGVGFETTGPAVAGAVLAAKGRKLKNFSVYCSLKLIPPALNTLFCESNNTINGLLCPGHVSVITGLAVYEPIARRFKLPCVVAGFLPVDILQGILMLVIQAQQGRAMVENAYGRFVGAHGNALARQVLETVFETCDAPWRGLGKVPGSGLCFKGDFSLFDAAGRFGLAPKRGRKPKGCCCAEVLKGQMMPYSCPLYKKVCTPQNPVGPCMVSGEGACAAHFRYS